MLFHPQMNVGYTQTLLLFAIRFLYFSNLPHTFFIYGALTFSPTFQLTSAEGSGGAYRMGRLPRPSSVCPSVCPSIRPQFQTTSPLKLQCRLLLNFIYSLQGLKERKIVQMVWVTCPAWPPCPYMVKTLKNLLLQNH